MSIFDYDRSKEWRGGVYLCSVKGPMMAEIVESKLASEGIPSQRRYRGFSNCVEIVLGQDFLEFVDIYVPEEQLEDARNIAVPAEPEEYIWPDGLEPDEEERPRPAFSKIKIKK